MKISCIRPLRNCPLRRSRARVSLTSVQRTWRPWLGPARPFIDPPAHAVILSVDEKSQIQDLDRTQPGLPLK